MSKQVKDAKQALKAEINTINTDLLDEISKVNKSTESLMDSIRAMRDLLTRSSAVNPPSRKELYAVFPVIFSAEEIAAYEAAMKKLQTKQSTM